MKYLHIYNQFPFIKALSIETRVELFLPEKNVFLHKKIMLKLI